MIDAARVVARARLLARAADRRRGRRRGVREHRRRRAGRRWTADARGRDRADRPADRRRPQGIRLARGRDARPRRARQPAARRPRRDHAHGARAAAARGARSRAAVAAAASADGHGVAARVDHRRRARAEQLSGSLPCCRWSGARVAGEAGETRRAEVERDPRRAARARIRSSTPTRACTFARPAYEIPTGHALPDALGAAAARRSACRAETVGMSFWTDAAVLGAAGIPRCCSGPAAPACTASRNT